MHTSRDVPPSRSNHSLNCLNDHMSHMKRIRNLLLLLFVGLACLSAQSHSLPEVVILEAVHNNTPHFKVETATATYFIEKQSGGCSSLLDSEGRDWIGFKLTGTDGSTLSSDSDYRGIRNLVYQDPGNGIGHPGFSMCETIQASGNELEVRSMDKQWQFRWIFHDTFAKILIEKTDVSRNYWFLYEGPVAGKFAPDHQYLGNNQQSGNASPDR